MSDIIQQTILNKVRKDKFILVLDTPKVLKDYQSNFQRENSLVNLDKMQFSVVGVNLPAHNIPAVGVPFMGQTPHVTSQTRQEYPPTKVTFTVDNNYDNYWFLWKWLYILNNPRESGMDDYFAEFNKRQTVMLDSTRDAGKIKKEKLNPVTYREIKMINSYFDYQTTVTLYGLREYDEKIIKFDYYNAFPVSLGELNYDYRETAELTCSFDFAFGQIDIALIDPT